jgi:RNA polymerase sigma factor (sigma-70 family)
MSRCIQRPMTNQQNTQASLNDAGRIVLVGLIGRVAGTESVAKDAAALQRIYHLTAAKLNGIIIAVLRDQALAEEVLQDTYVNVWRHAAGFNPSVSSPITWLAAIARNRAVDRLRMEQRLRADNIDDHEIVDDHLLAVDQLIAGETSDRLRHCLSCLDPDQQRAIRSAFFGGHTYDELAQREGIALSTMKSRIRRGLIRLRTCMDEA